MYDAAEYGRMKLGIVSDTHDNLDLVDAAVSTFQTTGVDVVIHCGDFIAPFAVSRLNTDAFDVYGVRGNNDGEESIGPTIDEFGTFWGECGTETFDGTSVAVYHGTSPTLTNALADCGDYDFVFHGHSHEHGAWKHGETVRVNPGGLPLSFADDAFHVAIVDTDRSGLDAVTHHELP